ncbi:MAG: HAD-IIB family hydrolase [Myxococcales bacterium]|nr:HAD-IIB family hydrolase [Myxococcales bacterium]
MRARRRSPLPPGEGQGEGPRALCEADFGRAEAVFTDVDATLTTLGKLAGSTVRALERLEEAGIGVVLVSGRPAGWGECWARCLPVRGVIVENGGLYFAPGRRGRLRKVYLQPAPERIANRRRLEREVEAAMARVPGARLSSDSAYTEVDLAIDYHEEARLGQRATDELERHLRSRGVTAVRSSVHVNCWIGRFDKLSAVRHFVSREWGLSLRRRDARFVYVGDSFNDSPMFGAFHLSVGVANVRAVLGRIEHPPAFVTPSPEGKGFEELAESVLAARR